MRRDLSLLLLMTGVSAFGSTIWYTDRASWEAAVIVSQTITFDGLAGAGSTADASGSPGFTAQGVTFTGKDEYRRDQLFQPSDQGTTYPLFLQNPIAPPTDPMSGTYLESGRYGSSSFGPLVSYDHTSILMNLAGATAMGWDWFTPQTDVEPILLGSVILSNGDSSQIGGAGTGGFIGFITTMPVTEVEVTPSISRAFGVMGGGGSSSGLLQLDNVTIGAAVPEPSSAVLTGSAALALGLILRGRMGRQVAQR